MPRSPVDYLRHILDEARYLDAQRRKISQQDFLSDETLRRAFVRSLEVMGEAAKHVSEDYRRAHPHIQWRALAGMRDLLIHHYFGVDYDIVWDVVVNEIPKVAVAVEKLIREEGATP